MKARLLVLAASLFVSVGVDTTAQSLAPVTFEPLRGDEVLTYSKAVIEKRGAIILQASDPSTGTRRRLCTIQNYDLGKVDIVSKGERAYFIIVNDDPEGVNSLWVANGLEGKAYPILKANSGFAVSSNGRFVCFQDVEYAATSGSRFPRIVTYDLDRHEAVGSADYTDSIFEGTVPKIKFTSSGHFHVSFVVENRTMGEADIVLPKGSEQH